MAGFFKKIFSFGKKEVVEERVDETAPLPPIKWEALDALKPGEVTKEPLQTPLGFVIFRLDGVTPYTPPPFEQVKDNMKRQAQKKAGEEQLAKIREAAKIVPAPGTTPVQPNTQLPQPPKTPPAKAEAKPAADGTKPQN